MLNKKSSIDILLSVVSGLMLAQAFLFPSLSWLAWLGLIPLLRVLDDKDPKDSFSLGYIAGAVFFLGTTYWLYNVSRWFSFIAAIGVTFLILYLALYWGLFALLYNKLRKARTLFRLFLVPCAWVVCEYLRSILFTGFSWSSLGLSQYRVLPLIQIADITGMFGVSFLIVMFNVGVKEVFSSRKRMQMTILAITVLILFSVRIYGEKKLAHSTSSGSINLVIVQGNVSLDEYWNDSFSTDNLKKYMSITREAVGKNVDVVIWPETSMPGFMAQREDLPRGFSKFLAALNTNLLVGVVTREDDKYFNSAILLSKSSEVVDVYNKQHLVMFGEYIPLRKAIPFLSAVVPIDDFSRGDKSVVFDLGEGKTFSVLICFEDTVADLAREAVNNGAGLLVNITNDAWFPNSKAPFMHLQSSVFRAIENRRGMVRSANTGISCIINSKGMVKDIVRGGKHEYTEVAGFIRSSAETSDIKTFYTKFGDVFTYLCFGCILLFNSINIFIKSKKGD